MSHPLYLHAVQQAADELRAAEPWLLVRYWNQPAYVASRRTPWMRLVTALVNVWRRPRRWWLGRLQVAYEARSRSRGTR